MTRQYTQSELDYRQKKWEFDKRLIPIGVWIPIILSMPKKPLSREERKAAKTKRKAEAKLKTEQKEQREQREKKEKREKEEKNECT